jgi:rod shape-determining protein MreB
MVACRPLAMGAVVDGELTAKYLAEIFRQTGSITFFSRPSVVIGVPRGSTAVERRAIEDAAYDAGARSISLIDEPTAAAIGAGLKITGARGNMIVDIGSGITEVTLLSLNGIVRTRAVRSAGDALDAAIVQYVRDQYGLLIGNGVAEWLKIRYGSLAPLQDRGTAEISGRGIRSGLPATVRLGTAELREAMTPWFDDLCDLLQQTLNETPPELAADLYDHGIVLCGGGALL